MTLHARVAPWAMLLAALGCATATAQTKIRAGAERPQGITTIAVGQTHTKAAGGSTTDLYRFAGKSGMTLKATLLGSGQSALILYAPTGEEMLTARGGDSVALEALLPMWDTFVIAVIRSDSSKPYKLRLQGDEPSAELGFFAYRVGFLNGPGGNVSTTCWVERGISKRINRSNRSIFALVTRGPGFVNYQFFDPKGQATRSEKLLIKVQDDGVLATYESGEESLSTFDMLVGSKPYGPFAGLDCKN